MRVTLLIFTLFTFFSLSQAAFAQKPKSDFISPITNEIIVAAIASEGYVIEKKAIGVDSDGEAHYHVKMDGRSVVLSINKDKHILRLMQIFRKPSGKPWSEASVNLWNRGRRLSKAYIDSDGDLTLVSELYGAGGHAGRSIEDFLRIFQMSSQMFNSEVVIKGYKK